MDGRIQHMLLFAVLGLMLCTGGCASYAAPGRGAELAVMGAPSAAELGPGTDGSIRVAFDKEPLAKFPTGVAMVRVQAPGYRSSTTEGWGQGRFSIVTTRDVEESEHFERLEKLPMIRGIAPINRLLLSGPLESDLVLRQAAAKMQADMLLIYTLDTTFTTENKLKPLSTITLGLSPNKQVRLTTTASAILMDTRNGYLYGLAEATARENRFTNSWQNKVAIDETRRSTETKAFDQLVGELEKTWQGVVASHAGAAPTAAAN